MRSVGSIRKLTEMEFRAKGLLGVDSWERKGEKEKGWSRKVSECSAGLTNSWPTQQGALEYIIPIRGIPCWAEMARSW